MKALALLAASCLALALAAAAQGKGPSQASISGPGLDEAVTIGGPLGGGDPAQGTALGNLTDQTGLFPALFDQSPDPMLDRRPKGKLGPRYLITWTLPNPAGSTDTIHMDLYPYARGGSLTYTKPGLKFFGTERSRGGWFRASPALRATLVQAGLPADGPATGSGGGFEVGSLFDGWLALLWAAAGLALLGVAGALMIRRRPPPAPAAR